jgi:hypothetical protein
MTQAEQPSVSAPLMLQMVQVMTGHALPRAIIAAVQLNLDMHLRDGPRSAGDLAGVTETDADTLYRLLRALAAVGLLTESEDGAFGLTPLGEHLRFARGGMVGDEAQRAWDELIFTVQTGQPAFNHVFGMGFYEYLAQHPEVAAVFDEYNAVTAGFWLPPVVAACDFAGADTVVDVGGGRGVFLAEVLRANPRLRGVLLDLPEVVAGSPAVFDAAGVRDRSSIVEGNFLDAVPAGGDVYTVSRVLFNWDDEHAVRILRNVRQAMTNTGRLLVIESPLQPLGDPRRAQGALNDLNVLLLMGGRQHTEAEFRALFEAAGFKMAGFRPADEIWYVIEGLPS